MTRMVESTLSLDLVNTGPRFRVPATRLYTGGGTVQLARLEVTIGMSDFLTKPVQMNALRETILRWTHR